MRVQKNSNNVWRFGQYVINQPMKIVVSEDGLSIKVSFVNNESLGTIYDGLISDLTYVENEVEKHYTDYADFEGRCADFFVNASSDGGYSISDIKITASSIAPYGWIFCNGAALSRTTYSALFAVIGTTYGAGDGSTTFNIPNLKGRTVVGADGTQTEFDTLGKTGGEKNHKLTVSEMPRHTHSLYPGMEERMLYNDGGARGALYKTAESENTSYTGGDIAHNNLQPYITLHYLIKY